MHPVALRPGADLAGFRHAVRDLIARGIPAQDVVWNASDSLGLFGSTPVSPAPPVALPRAVAEMIELVVCHREPERYALLYTLVWRVLHGEPALMTVQTDPLVHRLEMLRKAIRRDLHKMHAFVRFHAVDAADQRFDAWFEPDHFILEATADFFIERFRALDWTIRTPIGSLHWDRHQLVIGPPGVRGQAPAADAFEAGWCDYYQSTFNPARTNPAAMRAEMPKKYWRNLPETRAIPNLIRSSDVRVREMIERDAAVAVKRDPQKAVAAMAHQGPVTLAELNRLISASEPLVPGATRAVLGEGPVGAAVAFIGEQPGDEEDQQGRPFVGPAGQLLDQALASAGIERAGAYVTNAVKHFKFSLRGKRRIHEKPTAGEVKHYRWWLMKELDLVDPGLVVALGATAVLALAGKPLPVMRARGLAQFGDRRGFITVHPSYLLRLPDKAARHRAYDDFVADLRQVRDLLRQPAA
jgi:DNA polymerase